MSNLEQVKFSKPSSHAVCEGALNFMSMASTSSLLRNGKVFIDRDPKGNTDKSEGIDIASKNLMIINARTLEGKALSCEHNGFELQQQPLNHKDMDFLDHDQVMSKYYAECESIVRKLTGAQAFAFDHNVRSASGKKSQSEISGGQDVQGPAHLVHGDYTLRGAPERLQQLSKPPTGNDTLKGHLPDGQALIPEKLMESALYSGRFAIINVWRNIAHEPVATHPLALCDGQTVVPDDLVVFEIRYPDRVGENYFSKPAEKHRFYYYPEMTRDEVLLIKQWDSAGHLAKSSGMEADQAYRPCTFSFHSAFEPTEQVADAPDRWSIEVRCMVIYS